MHNTSCPPTLLSSLSPEPTPLLPRHGRHDTPPCTSTDEGVMFLFHASTSLSLILLLIHLSSLLLLKLFTSLYYKATPQRDVQEVHTDEYNPVAVAVNECSPKEDLVADVTLGGGLLFRHNRSRSNDTLLAEQGRDSKEQVSFDVEDATDVAESAYGSPSEDLTREKLGIEYDDARITDPLTPLDFPSPAALASDDAAPEEKSVGGEVYKDKEEKDSSDEEKSLVVDDHPRFGSKKFQLEDDHEDKENFGSSVTGESTSKSSIEWRSSTIFRDSEVEYPFSSSSRRSSSNWESYTLFRKYDEEMIFFDRISAQKLTETESFRSVKVHPRSISQRIVHKLTTKERNSGSRGRDPYQELESAYVAQICLTWEALNWNYHNFKRASTNRATDYSGCPARIGQQFQQFQVLLQRFIENEPYERGRRPEVYARVRISSPKLLRVPEFQESEDDDSKEDTSSKISSAEFLSIMEDAIQTFMNFLKADKESHCEKFRAFIKKRPSSAAPALLHLLKKVNKKKKLKLKELGRRRKCLRRRKLKEDEEMETVMGLIDMKVVSRVLRMPEISEQQLHWCEEKMNKVRVWDGKLERDSFPLFFPAH